MQPRRRIVGHRTVRAGDLVPHERNWRTHPKAQAEALQALYARVGFARSLLGYELPDGRLKLIDGHLRASLDPEQVVTVEVLDVSDEEALKLLLSIDPLASVAGVDEGRLASLRAKQAEADEGPLAALWDTIGQAGLAATEALPASTPPAGEGGAGMKRPAASEDEPERWLVIVKCADEAEQVGLLARLKAEGMTCRALMT